MTTSVQSCKFTSALDERQTGTSAEWYTKKTAHWLDVCRATSLAGTRMRVKKAELGGEQAAPFEQAFANLAHSYLRDRAPKLMEYEVGFQLLSKNPDNTKAVGVFGFKVADQWLFAPVFFLNGDLKGHELLYLKSQDLFVPLKDNWIDYLLGRKPAMLGKTISRQLNTLGHQPPDLARLSRNPYKWASVRPRLASWANEFLPALAYVATTKTAEVRVPFIEALVDSGRAGFMFLEKVAESYPVVFRALQTRYGDQLKTAARKVGENEAWSGDGASLMTKLSRKKPTEDGPSKEDQNVFTSGSVMNRLKGPPKKEQGGHVDIVLRQDFFNGNATDLCLSDDEKQTVIEEGRVVRDTRPASAISKTYAYSTSLKLFNPDETNIYDVLTKPGGFTECLVLMHPIGQDGVAECCTVVTLTGEKLSENVHSSRVYCRTRYSREAWSTWFDKLPGAESLSTEGRSYNREKVIILGRDGSGTFPVQSREEYADDIGKSYSVSFDDYACGEQGKPQFPTWKHTGWRGKNYMDVEQNGANIKYLRFTGRPGNKLIMFGEELKVPGGFKKIVVRPARQESDYLGDEEEDKKPKKRPLAFGDLADVQQALTGSTTPLELLDDKTEVSINDTKYLKESAFRALVVDWGMRADLADHLLKIAADAPRVRHKYLVKKADPFLDGGPSAPSFPDYNYQSDTLIHPSAPTLEPDVRFNRVNDMVAKPDARDKYKPLGPDPDTMQLAGRATSTGQQDVFDTAMLGSLLKAVRQDNMVDKYIGDLMKGMDRKGRIFFQFLWHGEEFEERYGKQDLPEIEDGLRNAFESDGDIILTLKRKSVEPFADQGHDIDLGALANQ